jgi:hypothetical protein
MLPWTLALCVFNEIALVCSDEDIMPPSIKVQKRKEDLWWCFLVVSPPFRRAVLYIHICIQSTNFSNTSLLLCLSLHWSVWTYSLLLSIGSTRCHGNVNYNSSSSVIFPIDYNPFESFFFCLFLFLRLFFLLLFFFSCLLLVWNYPLTCFINVTSYEWMQQPLVFFLSSFLLSVVRFMTSYNNFYKEMFWIWIMYDSSSHCVVRFQRNLWQKKVLLTVKVIIAKVV